jgi:hypothetical protein
MSWARRQAVLAAASPEWNTGDVVATVDVEEALREELRPLARKVVRRLVLDLAREELGRLGASLNGGPPPPVERVLLARREPQDSTRPLAEGSGPPPAATSTRRRCSACGEEKPAWAFEPGRRTCRACRAEAARRNYRKRHGQTHAAAEAKCSRPRGGTGVSVELLASRIAAAPDRVASLLTDELARGRVRQDGDRWTLVPSAFPPGTVEALRGLA